MSDNYTYYGRFSAMSYFKTGLFNCTEQIVLVKAANPASILTVLLAVQLIQ